MIPQTEAQEMLKDLRDQTFYKGQILRVRDLPGVAPRAFDLKSFFEQVPKVKGGILSRVLPVLGLYEIYEATTAATAKAYSQADDGTTCDTILVSPYSAGRELFWQLVCLSEALDFSRMCIVLCRDSQQVNSVRYTLNSTLARADIQYALTVATINDVDDMQTFDADTPLVVLMTPQGLDCLLSDAVDRPLKKQLLSSLARVILPCLDAWPPPLASHVAFLLRRLHMECALHGVFPALVATMLPTANTTEFIIEFWGKPVSPGNLILQDSVEASPICLVNYGGALVHNKLDPNQWLREPISKAASDLISWLVGSERRHHLCGAEIHYLLDTSGSMCDRLNEVKETLIQDIYDGLDYGHILKGDVLRLTSFDTSPHEQFTVTVGVAEDLEEQKTTFQTVLEQLVADGGTDISRVLGSVLANALRGVAQTIKVVLFSDGESAVSESERAELIQLTRQARAEGRALSIVYVVADMEPPVEIRNLIDELGGIVVSKQGGERDTEIPYCGITPSQNVVVLLSGEKGLPESIVQSFQLPTCPLVFARSVSDLLDKAKGLRFTARDVSAVVVSGRYGSLPQIVDQIRHLGRAFLPVFVLSEPEAWSQALCEDHPEPLSLLQTPLIWTRNMNVLQAEMEKTLPSEGIMDADLFAYILKGSENYRTMLHRWGVEGHAAYATASPLKIKDLPQGFTLIRRMGYMAVQRQKAEPQKIPGSTGTSATPSLETWTQNTVKLTGLTAVIYQTDALLEKHPLLFHKGAVIDGAATSTEVELERETIKLVERTYHRYAPLINLVSVQPLGKEDGEDVGDLGRVSLQPVQFTVQSPGYCTYAREDLDATPIPHRNLSASPMQSLETLALRWEPQFAGGEEKDRSAVQVGLANLLRMMLVAVFPWADRTVFVYPDENNAIWVVDLAPGGNGAANYLRRHMPELRSILQTAAFISLECPCEGGFAGVSTDEPPPMHDTGCPRCVRVVGPVINVPDVPGNPIRDRFAGASKRGTILWLRDRGLLPAEVTTLHLDEKYDGIKSLSRYRDADAGTRRGLMRLVCRIFRDRLGIDLPSTLWAKVAWLNNDDPRLYGQYCGGSNRTLSVHQNLREWMAVSVCAHELFHNAQDRVSGLCNATLLNSDKIFLEGAAVWAESHVLDALAIRTALDFNNLRQGDVYAKGFQLFKKIEEEGGLRAVLRYLRGAG